jgi:hypothetical protein
MALSSLDLAKRRAAEVPHTLNLEHNLVRQMRLKTDDLLNDFLLKHEGRFTGPINEEILEDSNNLRREVLNILETACQNIMRMFGKSIDEIDPELLEKDQEHGYSKYLDSLKESDSSLLSKKEIEYLEGYKLYLDFLQRHGWTINAAGDRHPVRRDELAYELCEVIRKVYYVHLEDNIPDQYKLEIVEKYTLKEEHVAEN